MSKINAPQVSRRTLPSNDRIRRRIVQAAADKLGAKRIGRRLWAYQGRYLGTARMVALAGHRG